MRYSIIVASLAVVATGTSAQSPDTTTLGTVVVSATKAPSEKTSLAQAVTVIRGDEIRARGITRVSDALRLVPGAAVVQNGSTGSVNTLFLRGGESRYTRVLIDGVSVNAPGGFFDFSHLTTDNVDRIEVVRGPASVVHGADAMTGVIQIFTRQGEGGFRGSAELRGGTYGTREASLEGSGSSGIARYSAAGSARRTDGIIDFNNGYYNGTLSGSAGVSPADGSDIVLSTRYTAAEFHYPTDFTGAPVDSNSYRVQHRLTVGLDASTRLADRLTARLRLGTNEVSDLTEDISVPFGSQQAVSSSFLSRNKRRSAELGFAAALPFSATVSAGAEYVGESERSVNESGPVAAPSEPTSSFSATRSAKAVYAEVVGSAGRVASYTAALRRDDNSDYGANTTYRAGVSVPLTAGSRFRGSASTAFNAPAFNQLRPTLYTSGSPDLKPERGVSWEVGAEQTLGSGRVVLAAGYFRQRFIDMIQYVAGGPPLYLGSFSNLTEAESNGYEAEASLRLAREWSASAGYTFAKPRVTRVSSEYSGDLVEGDALIRRPRHSGNATVGWTRNARTSLSATAAYIGSRPDVDFAQFPSPLVTLESYVRVDIAGSAEIFRFARGRSAISLTGRVENAFDKDYEDVLNFTTPGRTILIGARYSGSL